MPLKPNYEELEELVNSLTQELSTCRNFQRLLQQAEQTAKALLNATTDSAILIDTKGKILAVNEILNIILKRRDVICAPQYTYIDLLDRIFQTGTIT